MGVVDVGGAALGVVVGAAGTRLSTAVAGVTVPSAGGGGGATAAATRVASSDDPRSDKPADRRDAADDDLEDAVISEMVSSSSKYFVSSGVAICGTNGGVMLPTASQLKFRN